MKVRIIITQDEDNLFVVECPTLPGCVSQGKTRTEAIKNIRDAIEGYMASLKKHDEPNERNIYVFNTPKVQT